MTFQRNMHIIIQYVIRYSKPYGATTIQIIIVTSSVLSFLSVQKVNPFQICQSIVNQIRIPMVEIDTYFPFKTQNMFELSIYSKSTYA